MSHFPPEGGCFVKCHTPMPCGHICPKICKIEQTPHIRLYNIVFIILGHVEDREHMLQKCHESCLRSCSVGHRCPKRCYQDCYPCLTKIPKILLPCNHTQITECYKDPETEYCLTKVVKVFFLNSYTHYKFRSYSYCLIGFTNLQTYN